ncbi:MAG: DUF222 domain-containing protein, partial [Nitriliruptoraceae bacterium]
MQGTEERSAAPQQLGAALSAMSHGIDAVARMDLDRASDQELDELLAGVRRPLQQLEGIRARAAALQQSRRLASRGSVPTEVALTEHRRALGEQQGLAPSETGRVLDAGRAAAPGTATGQAVRDGRIGLSQARTIGRVLASLVGAQREEVEAELVDQAARLDPVAFGRAARAVQARIQPEVLAGVQRRQGFERRFQATDTEDGGFAFSGLLYGSAAETARCAVEAFRRPDTPDEHRTPAQRGADAFEQLCAAALRSGAAPTRHGVRPQVMVTVSAADLALLEQEPERASGVFVGSGQPVAGPQLRHLLADCQLLRVVLDAAGVPIEVSRTVRTVPAGLWRALLVRDGGCTWPGCDAPANWCDVAHAIEAYADDGKLSLDNAMLLCRRHHRRYDASDLTVRIEGGTVHFPPLGVRTPACGDPGTSAR